MDPLDASPLVVRRHHPSRVDWWAQSGRITRVLPGIYRPREAEETFELRVQAVHLWNPGAAFLGAAAARLSWWEELAVDRIQVSGTKSCSPAPWLRVTKRRVPSALLRNRGAVLFAGPELSILDLAASGDGNAICEGLRRGATTLARLRTAAEQLSRTRGNPTRLLMLEESRDEPWSPLEREAHMLLRAAGIRGWTTNHAVTVGDRRFYIDIAFPRLRIAVEIDGENWHGWGRWQRDITRQNKLVVEGWRVLRFTHATLPDLVDTLRTVLGQAAADRDSGSGSPPRGPRTRR